MKKLFIFLMIFVAASATAQTYSRPANLSSGGVADWANAGGFIASGTSSPATTPGTGALYFNSEDLLLYRFDGSKWDSIAGGSSGESAVFVDKKPIWFAEDIGKGWVLATDTECLRVEAIAYCGSDTVLACGYGSNIVNRSIDGGDTWTAAFAASGSNLRSVAYTGQGSVIVGGDSIHYSFDRGENWDELGVATGSVEAICSIVYAGDGVALAGTLDGKILQTTDGGANFSIATTTPEVGQMNVCAANGAGVVIFAAENGTNVFRSADFGTTWTVIPWSGSEYLLGVEYCGNSIFIAASVYGTVYRSSDNGVTWATVSGQVFTTGAIKYLGSGVVVADDTATERLYVSTDFGETWGFTDLKSNRVFSIESVGGGRLLFGTGFDGGIYKSDGNNL